MTEKEIYDYLSAATPDYNAFLTLAMSPNVINEMPSKAQEVHSFDDGSERVIDLDDTPIVFFVLRWPDGITKEDAGTILDFYMDAAKANRFARSFKYTHPADGHTYVVKFRSDLNRKYAPEFSLGYLPVKEIRMKVMGVISD